MLYKVDMHSHPHISSLVTHTSEPTSNVGPIYTAWIESERVRQGPQHDVRQVPPEAVPYKKRKSNTPGAPPVKLWHLLDDLTNETVHCRTEDEVEQYLDAVEELHATERGRVKYVISSPNHLFIPTFVVFVTHHYVQAAYRPPTNILQVPECFYIESCVCMPRSWNRGDRVQETREYNHCA